MNSPGEIERNRALAAGSLPMPYQERRAPPENSPQMQLGRALVGLIEQAMQDRSPASASRRFAGCLLTTFAEQKKECLGRGDVQALDNMFASWLEQRGSPDLGMRSDCPELQERVAQTFANSLEYLAPNANLYLQSVLRQLCHTPQAQQVIDCLTAARTQGELPELADLELPETARPSRPVSGLQRFFKGRWGSILPNAMASESTRRQHIAPRLH